MQLGFLLLVPGAASSFLGSSAAIARPIRAPPSCMLAKKPFKGGRLDDFLSAGEAEAKYGHIGF